MQGSRWACWALRLRVDSLGRTVAVLAGLRTLIEQGSSSVGVFPDHLWEMQPEPGNAVTLRLRPSDPKLGRVRELGKKGSHMFIRTGSQGQAKGDGDDPSDLGERSGKAADPPRQLRQGGPSKRHSDER